MSPYILINLSGGPSCQPMGTHHAILNTRSECSLHDQSYVSLTACPSIGTSHLPTPQNRAYFQKLTVPQLLYKFFFYVYCARSFNNVLQSTAFDTVLSEISELHDFRSYLFKAKLNITISSYCKSRCLSLFRFPIKIWYERSVTVKFHGT
jgi:hypothetical protein